MGTDRLQSNISVFFHHTLQMVAFYLRGICLCGVSGAVMHLGGEGCYNRIKILNGWMEVILTSSFCSSIESRGFEMRGRGAGGGVNRVFLEEKNTVYRNLLYVN